MGDIVYRIRPSDALSHAYVSPYKTNTYDPSKRANRYERDTPLLDKAKAAKKAGNYKSPYYDPVARHERYMKERKSLGIGQGFSAKKSSGGSSRGGSGKSSRGGSGKSSRGGSSGSNSRIAAEIEKLRNESSLNTDAQREAARRKIEDLQNELTDRINQLRKNAVSSAESETNSAERRGILQNLKAEIENLQNKTFEESSKVSKQLENWIGKEQESLERRIASIQGTKYDPSAKKKREQQQKARNKEVMSRADAIYKSKSKK